MSMTDTNTPLNAQEASTWALVWAFHTGLPGSLDTQLKRDANLTYFEFQALAAIKEATNGSIRMSELAETTGMSLSHLSRVITRLEKKEFVSRVPDPQDGRATFAEITDEGRAALDKALPGHVGALRRILFDNLEPDEQEVLDSVLRRVSTALSEEDAAPQSSEHRRLGAA